MYSIGFAMTLRPGAYAEYKRAHDDPWPELVKDMEANGISMAIFRDGDRLVVHAVAPTAEHWERSRRKTPVFDKWHAYMATLLETDAEGGLVVKDLPEAFAFGLFTAG